MIITNGVYLRIKQTRYHQHVTNISSLQLLALNLNCKQCMACNVIVIDSTHCATATAPAYMSHVPALSHAPPTRTLLQESHLRVLIIHSRDTTATASAAAIIITTAVVIVVFIHHTGHTYHPHHRHAPARRLSRATASSVALAATTAVIHRDRFGH